MRPRTRFRAGLILSVAYAALVVACGGGTDQGTSAVAPLQTTPATVTSTEPPPDDNSPSETPEQPLESASLGGTEETVEAEPSAVSGTSDGEENQAPTLTRAVGSQEVVIGEALRVAVGAHFEDPNGDPLRYGASSSDEAVATVSVSGTTIEIIGVEDGEATVTITARDARGQSARLSVSVRVAAQEPGTVRVLYARPSDREFRFRLQRGH